MALLLVASAHAQTPTPSPAPTPAAKQSGGKTDKKAEELKLLTIKDGEIVLTIGDKEEKAKFKLDPSKKPAEIDIDPGKNDRTVPGIYQTKDTDKGLELTIAFGDGPKAERPTDFKGEGRVVVLKLLRKK